MQQFLRIFPDMHVYSDPYPIQFGSGDWITVVTNATGTFTGEMTLPDGTVIPPTGKAFDVEFGQTTKWDGDQLIVISAFYDAAVQEAADRPRLMEQMTVQQLAAELVRASNTGNFNEATLDSAGAKYGVEFVEAAFALMQEMRWSTG